MSERNCHLSTSDVGLVIRCYSGTLEEGGTSERETVLCTVVTEEPESSYFMTTLSK